MLFGLIAIILGKSVSLHGAANTHGIEPERHPVNDCCRDSCYIKAVTRAVVLTRCCCAN